MHDPRCFCRWADDVREEEAPIECRRFAVASPTWPRRFGLISQVMLWKLNLYVPTGAVGVDVVARLVDRFPINRACDRKAA
ncbi:hypothetical protein [Sphingopyxis sp. JAI108]|uniref:hypothetical protein n=1 Tax=Sphingopyxis sp. JAI108 TaxID=2723060 RepID=UPI0015CB7033|nr:hypothetical protein [Sphingopyxis sp. JAI108]NYF30656.1 hypothetical protein [Sphingopyxis sp. JAI108]